MSREWLIHWRKAKFSSQAALAREVGITTIRYSRIESGYCDIKPAEIEALSAAFNVSPEAILTGSKKNNAISSPPPTVHTGIEHRDPRPTATVAVADKPMPMTIRIDDLSDPKNFALQPPTELLVQQGSRDAAASAHLKEAIAYSEKVLHTSKVRPAIWVAWRDFNRNALNALRDQNAPVTRVVDVPHRVVTPTVIVKPVPTVVPTANKLFAVSPRDRTRGNKNAFGHFVDIARETLPPEVVTTISDKAATAKKNQPELGFMKHFRRIAEEVLSPEVFGRIDREAISRTGIA